MRTDPEPRSLFHDRKTPPLTRTKWGAQAVSWSWIERLQRFRPDAFKLCVPPWNWEWVCERTKRGQRLVLVVSCTPRWRSRAIEYLRRERIEAVPYRADFAIAVDRPESITRFLVGVGGMRPCWTDYLSALEHRPEYVPYRIAEVLRVYRDQGLQVEPEHEFWGAALGWLVDRRRRVIRRKSDERHARERQQWARERNLIRPRQKRGRK